MSFFSRHRFPDERGHPPVPCETPAKRSRAMSGFSEITGWDVGNGSRCRILQRVIGHEDAWSMAASIDLPTSAGLGGRRCSRRDVIASFAMASGVARNEARRDVPFLLAIRWRRSTSLARLGRGSHFVGMDWPRHPDDVSGSRPARVLGEFLTCASGKQVPNGGEGDRSTESKERTGLSLRVGKRRPLFNMVELGRHWGAQPHQCLGIMAVGKLHAAGSQARGSWRCAARSSEGMVLPMRSWMLNGPSG